MEDNDDFGLDGVVVDWFSVLSENTDGGDVTEKEELSFLLVCGLGVVTLIDGDFTEEEEGDRERV